MEKILRLKDRVAFNLDGISIKLAPLSFQQQLDINACSRKVNGEDISDDGMKILLLVKYALKDISGLRLYDDSEYKIEFDGNGNLSDECAGEIMNMPIRENIIKAVNKIMENDIDGIDAKDVKVELGK